MAGAALSAAYLFRCVLFRRPSPAGPVVFFFCLGWLAVLPYEAPHIPENHVSRFADRETGWRVSGTVSTPVEWKNGRWRFVVDVDRLESEGRALKVRGSIRASCWFEPRGVGRSRRVSFVSRLYPISGFKNPGGFDYERYMRRRGIHASAYPWRDAGIDVAGEPDLSSRFLEGFRDRVGKLVRSRVEPPGQGVLRALLLGERGYIDPAVEEDFRRTGTAHILAISGLHVGMVALFSMFLLRGVLFYVPGLALRGGHLGIAAALSILPVLFYGSVAGWSVSTQRAAVMVAVFLLAFCAQREIDPYNTLAAAGIAVLAAWPPALFTPSFQLSFAAVFFIVLGMARLPRGWIAGPGHRVRKRTFSLFAVSCLAALATAPLGLHYFYSMSYVGPVVNMVFVPLTGFAVLPLGLGAAFLEPLSSTAAGWLMRASGGLMNLTVEGISSIAGFSATAGMPWWPSVSELVVFYTALACLLSTGRTRLRMVVLAGCLVFFLADGAYWRHARFGGDDLSVAVLDVGQGACTVVGFPDGTTMLVDGGGFSHPDSFDIGEGVVGPYLWRNRIHTVDYLVLSHPQSDHAGGLGFVAERFAVGRFWHNGQRGDNQASQRVFRAVRDRGIPAPVVTSELPVQRMGGATVEILSPEPDFLEREAAHSDVNEHSLVLKITHGARSVLICGDAGRDSEAAMLKKFGTGALRADVLLAPHHGSRTSSSPDFVRAVAPGWVVVQAREPNRHGLPAPEVVRRYTAAGAVMLLTGRHGAVRVATDGDRMTVTPRVPAPFLTSESVTKISKQVSRAP